LRLQHKKTAAGNGHLSCHFAQILHFLGRSLKIWALAKLESFGPILRFPENTVYSGRQSHRMKMAGRRAWR
jgi:hypothetical protein